MVYFSPAKVTNSTMYEKETPLKKRTHFPNSIRSIPWHFRLRDIAVSLYIELGPTTKRKLHNSICSLYKQGRVHGKPAKNATASFVKAERIQSHSITTVHNEAGSFSPVAYFSHIINTIQPGWRPQQVLLAEIPVRHGCLSSRTL